MLFFPSAALNKLFRPIFSLDISSHMWFISHMSNMFDSEKQKKRRKALMVEAGLSQAEVARSLNVERSTVCGVVSGEKKSKRIMEYIADRLGMEMADLWISEKTAA